MATQFQFRVRSTGEVTSLNDVDRAMCDDSTTLYDAEKFCMLYEVITVIGFVILKKYGGSVVTEETFTSWLTNDKEDEDDADFIKLCRKYLLEDYIFEAWYSVNF